MQTDKQYSIHCQDGCAAAFFDTQEDAIEIFKRHSHPCVLVSPDVQVKHTKITSVTDNKGGSWTKLNDMCWYKGDLIITVEVE